ncbi:DEAD/DEAH box helicase [Hoeflea alexandrii]|uniref:DEAD/DEAH box helicase n=1 Tax=Hoeflea alexandrii TaxID=288436 RepID=UPI00226DA4E7|nr:DEAD/DEAH box helicase [Hoeflea alexandrii]MCY0151672.1 DEAD/DEAH box helicase [Hoeflea alexandrii]
MKVYDVTCVKCWLSSAPRAGALLQQPVIEGAHPFVTAEANLDALARSILHPAFVTAIDELPEGHDYRFPRNRKPFKHQLEAWQLLSSADSKSVVVTSGTGSGKTECFLFPILSDLAAQSQDSLEPIEGVQAIMLYPLNALIESQQERLSAWTRPFRGTIRYGLYNGDMERTSSASDRRARPEQVIDRETLRASPPPILVTNITMLEYMLVRAEDQPILNASRGKLKWIVLDEAHSLVGAAAAEVALLLRRTMLAFGVKPDEVRFVATSATIGSGKGTLQQLQKFLADVAGVSEDRVHVVEGRRQMPTRPTPAPLPVDLDLPATPSDRLYEILGGHTPSWDLVNRMFDQGVPLADFSAAAQTLKINPSGLVDAMSRASRTLQDGTEERLAPMRLHAFERALPGLWSCVNPACSHQVAEWPFGALLPDRADQCPHCAAPVLEVVSCTECGEVYLDGEETNGRISAPLRNPPRDEFAFDLVHDTDLRDDDDEEEVENPEQADDEALTLTLEHLFAANPTTCARPFWLDPHPDGWRVADGATADTLSLRSERKDGAYACPHCTPIKGAKEILRPVRFGAPFLLGNAAPILLEAVLPSQQRGEKLPSLGRRLLSFTDSRQGTARMAAKLQTESERSFVRSFIYHQVQASMGATGDLDKIEASRAAIKGLEVAVAASPSPQLDDLLRNERKNLDKLTLGSQDGIVWSELVTRLASRYEVQEWIFPLWQPRGDGVVFTDEFKLAEFLVLREFDRRPKRATSLESFGLAKLINPAIAGLTDATLPRPFKARGKTLGDWKAYLDTVLTHFVRNNRFTTIDKSLLHWISHKAVRRSLIGPDRNTDGDTTLRAWPNGHFRASPRSRPVALLLAGLKLHLGNNADREELDECLYEAWKQVQSSFSDDPERRIFDFAKTRVAPVVDAFWCPVTRRVLDCAPFGLTPYGLTETSDERRQGKPLTMPRHPKPLLGHVDFSQAKAETQLWLEGEEVAALRNKGAWTNISDRLALFSDYARSAEHSAQQESRRLRQYEQQFKA